MRSGPMPTGGDIMTNYYDEYGNYKGKKDEEGRFYDDSGNYLGRVDEEGRFYDQHGNYRGKRQDQ